MNVVIQKKYRKFERIEFETKSWSLVSDHSQKEAVSEGLERILSWRHTQFCVDRIENHAAVSIAYG